MDLKKSIAEQIIYHSSIPMRVAMSHKNTIATFIPTDTSFQSMLVIVDKTLNPLFSYITNAYIFGVTLSDSGRYSACVTASSPTKDKDGDSIFFVDIKNNIVNKYMSPVHCKYIKGLFIDELNKKIFIKCKDRSFTINF